MAFTGDFNTPVTVHVTVTFYICLTVYADPSTSCALCAGCKRVSIEFITCNATKKTTRPIGGKNSCRLSIFVPIEVQKNSIDISRDQWDLLSRVLWENIVIKSPLSNLQFKTIAGLTVSVLSRMFHHVNFEMHSPWVISFRTVSTWKFGGGKALNLWLCFPSVCCHHVRPLYPLQQNSIRCSQSWGFIRVSVLIITSFTASSLTPTARLWFLYPAHFIAIQEKIRRKKRATGVKAQMTSHQVFHWCKYTDTILTT